MNITCAICGSDCVKRVRKKFAARYKQVPVVIKNAEMYRCTPCGKEFFTAEQSRELSQRIEDRVRDDLRLL